MKLQLFEHLIFMLVINVRKCTWKMHSLFVSYASYYGHIACILQGWLNIHPQGCHIMILLHCIILSAIHTGPHEWTQRCLKQRWIKSLISQLLLESPRWLVLGSNPSSAREQDTLNCCQLQMLQQQQKMLSLYNKRKKKKKGTTKSLISPHKAQNHNINVCLINCGNGEIHKPY